MRFKLQVSSLPWIPFAVAILAMPPMLSAQNAADPAAASARHALSIAPPDDGPVVADRGSVQFIGNATVLIRYMGVTILTDPNFLPKGDAIGFGFGFGAQRVVGPGVEMAALPPLDLVLLSSMREDHFDRLARQKLDRAVAIVSLPAISTELEHLGFRQRYPLAPWDAIEVRKGEALVRISAVPARHGIDALAALMPESMGAIVDFSHQPSGARYRIYISGDTMPGDAMHEIGRRFPNIDLALLHLGGERMLGMLKVSMDAADGVRLFRIVGPQRAIPIHYNDYDSYGSTLEDFGAETRAAGLESKIIYLKHGEAYTFAPSKR